LIAKFKIDPGNRVYDNLILPYTSEFEFRISYYCRFYNWCQMQRYGLNILCPLHKLPLSVGFCSDKLQKRSKESALCTCIQVMWKCITLPKAIHLRKWESEAKVFLWQFINT